MSKRYEEYKRMLTLCRLGISYDECEGRVKFHGDDTELILNARKYLCRHPELLKEIIGESYEPDCGAISTDHELDVWSAVLAPLNRREELIHDYWTERQAMRYADGLPSDFHSAWEANKDSDCLMLRLDESEYWGDV